MESSTPFLSIKNDHNGLRDVISLCFLYLNFILFTSFDWQLKLLQFKVFSHWTRILLVFSSFHFCCCVHVYLFIFTVRALAHLHRCKRVLDIRRSLYLVIFTLKISKKHLQNRRKNNLSWMVLAECWRDGSGPAHCDFHSLPPECLSLSWLTAIGAVEGFEFSRHSFRKNHINACCRKVESVCLFGWND